MSTTLREQFWKIALMMGMVVWLSRDGWAQMCCGSLCVQFSQERLAKSDALEVTVGIADGYQDAPAAPKTMHLRHGSYCMGWFPHTPYDIAFRRRHKEMTIHLENPPDYDSRSYALAGVKFRRGNYYLDAQQVEAYIMEGAQSEKSGPFQYYTLIPLEFLKPLQKGQ